MFEKKDYKQAVAWLKERNYPLDLTKYLLDFTIVDLANLLAKAEEKLNDIRSHFHVRTVSSLVKRDIIQINIKPVVKIK